MIEHNSNKMMWALGAIAVSVLLITGMRTLASVFMQDITARVSNPTATYLDMESNNLLSSQYWNSEDITEHSKNSLTYEVPANPSRTDTNY